MPCSMTGYGAARRTTPLGALSVEIRSVNNRFLEVGVRTPSDLREWEMMARQLLQKRLNRGKVDLSVSWQPAAEARPKMAVNGELLSGLIEQVRPLAGALQTPPAQLLGPLSALPGVLEIQRPELDTATLFADLNALLNEAVDRLIETRAREGEALAADLIARAENLRAMSASIRGARETVIERYRARLREMIASLSQGAQAALHPDRLELEVALLADRCDVSEELTRLSAHIDALEALLRSGAGEPMGKRLEFLVQELLREVNTTGSKARDTEVIQTVLQMKHEIEKIREQVMNFE